MPQKDLKNMHQNKPVAPISYLNHKGEKVLVEDITSSEAENPLHLSLKEIAVLQTCLNRSYFNCNCDLNKDVLNAILFKVKNNLKLYG